ncbi:response regulator transcription factor [soil metagenome]
MTAIRVLIADDQSMVRTGLRSLLEGEPEIEVIAEAGDGEQALASIRRFEPDVALMDIRMPNLDGIEATRRLTAESVSTRVLILTTYDLDEYVYEGLRAGASGFLLKDAPAEDLIAGVRAVAAGDGLLAPAVTRRVIESFAGVPRADPGVAEALEELSARELEVLRLLARGNSNREIAAELVVTEATAKTHVSNVLAKLGIRDRVQAVILAYESGLIQPEGRAPL